jgi:hypothetical protein
MQYNDTTNGNGIIQSCEDLCDLGSTYISSSTPNLKTFALKGKKVTSELWFIIWNNSGSWQYDDGNYTDLPYATTELTSGSFRYALPSDALTVNQISVKNRAGDLVRIYPLDKANSKEIDRDKTGEPIYYNLINGTVELYPKPDYTQSAGLKVEFDRAGVDFDYNDTTQQPGFASPFHYLVPLGMSIEWLKTKQPNSPTLQEYKLDYEKGKQSLADFYSERFGDEGQPKLKAKIENCE